MQQWEWRLNGACRAFDPSMFYPETEAAAAKAKRICEGCDVLLDCRAYAMSSRENSGVWGGLSERERRRIWRRERQSA